MPSLVLFVFFGSFLSLCCAQGIPYWNLTYTQLDFDKDGFLSLSDVKQAISKTWMPTDRIVRWFKGLDIDGDEILTRSEGRLLHKRLQMEVKRCADEALEEFGRSDLDRDGLLGLGELTTFLAKSDGVTKTLIEIRFGEYDLDADGKIIVNEFISHQMIARCF